MPKYVIVSPVRDEEGFIEKTLISVAHQTVAPAEWIIVDDGSRDRTAVIVQEYAGRYPGCVWSAGKTAAAACPGRVLSKRSTTAIGNWRRRTGISS